MFTGIVETTGSVLRKTDTGLVLERPAAFDDLRTGASIAVSGVCLSVVEFDGTSMRFDIIPETWARTNLGGLRGGDRVNLERSMKATDRFEGHVVQGHVEGTGEVISLSPQLSAPTPELSAPTPDPSPVTGGGRGTPEADKEGERAMLLTIRIPSDLLPGVIPKGSVAVDGVSLTVAAIEGDRCSIALIPHTLAVTTLGRLRPGDRVNIETDMMLRGLRHLLSSLSHGPR